MSHDEPTGHAPSAGERRQRPASESTRLRTALAGPAGPALEYLKRIPVRVDGSLLLIPASRVVMIVARGERLTVSTVDQNEYSLLYRLKDLETRLDPSDFVRLSRSLIVNVNAVSRIQPESGGTNKVLLDNGQEVRMSRNQAGRLRRILVDLLELRDRPKKAGG